MREDAVIILQARMGSARLPGKVLAPIGDRTQLGHCLARLRASAVGTVVVATTREQEDDVLAAEATRAGVDVVRGARLDVLDRFATAARQTGVPFVIRATADNPAVDIDAPRRVLESLRRLGGDYCTEHGLPVGGGVEAMTARALFDAHARAVAADDREHVTTYIRRHASRYRLIDLPAPEPLHRPELRLTVDTAADLTFIRAVARALDQSLAQASFEAVIAAADRVRGRERVA